MGGKKTIVSAASRRRRTHGSRRPTLAVILRSLGLPPHSSRNATVRRAVWRGGVRERGWGGRGRGVGDGQKIIVISACVDEVNSRGRRRGQQLTVMRTPRAPEALPTPSRYIHHAYNIVNYRCHDNLYLSAPLSPPEVGHAARERHPRFPQCPVSERGGANHGLTVRQHPVAYNSS